MFWGELNKKKKKKQNSLEYVRSNINNHGKNKRELLNTETLPGNFKKSNKNSGWEYIVNHAMPS